MTKKVIAVISVLKPVDDTRNYEKVARSIGNTNKYDINIIGFSTKNIPNDPSIHFYPVFNFKRLSFKRLTAPLKIWKILFKLKPELIIVTTPELLIVSILNRILFGSKIIYDIQENYYRNIRFTQTYPTILRYPIALAVRTLEYTSSVFIHQFIMAENVYMEQMNFLANRSVVIENKALIPNEFIKLDHPNKEKLIFVYSGTIAEHYGLFDAIEFIIQLKKKIESVSLVIIGFAARKKTFQKLTGIIAAHDYIKLTGGDELVPHNQILIELSKADFCLLPYKENKSTAGRIPTKLYECLVMEKPLIITSNPAWDALIKKNNAGIIHDFQSIPDSLILKLNKKYYGNNLSDCYAWENSESTLLSLIQGAL